MTVYGVSDAQARYYDSISDGEFSEQYADSGTPADLTSTFKSYNYVDSTGIPTTLPTEEIIDLTDRWSSDDDVSTFCEDFNQLSAAEQEQVISWVSSRGELDDGMLRFLENLVLEDSDNNQQPSEVEKALKTILGHLDADQLVNFYDKTQNENALKTKCVDCIVDSIDDETKIELLDKLASRTNTSDSLWDLENNTSNWDSDALYMAGNLIASINNPATLQTACGKLSDEQLATVFESTLLDRYDYNVMVGNNHEEYDLTSLTNIIRCASTSSDTAFKERILDAGLTLFPLLNGDERGELATTLTSLSSAAPPYSAQNSSNSSGTDFNEKIALKLLQYASTEEDAEILHTFFEGLSGDEVNNVIACANPEYLKNNYIKYLPQMAGDSPQDQLDLFKSFASELNSDMLTKLYNLLDDDTYRYEMSDEFELGQSGIELIRNDELQRYFISSICQYADDQTKVEFIDNLDCTDDLRPAYQWAEKNVWDFDAQMAANLLCSLDNPEVFRETITSMDPEKRDAIINSSFVGTIDPDNNELIIPSFIDRPGAGSEFALDTDLVDAMIDSAMPPVFPSAMPPEAIPEASEEDLLYRSFVFETVSANYLETIDSHAAQEDTGRILDDLTYLLNTDPIKMITCLKNSGRPNDPDNLVPDNSEHGKGLAAYMHLMLKNGDENNFGELENFINVFTDEMVNYWNQEGWGDVDDRINEQNAENLGYVMGAMCAGITSLNSDLALDATYNSLWNRSINKLIGKLIPGELFDIPNEVGVRTLIDLSIIANREEGTSANNLIREELELKGFPTEIRTDDEQKEPEYHVKDTAFEAYLEKLGYIIDMIG